jgi:hypothetical protein
VRADKGAEVSKDHTHNQIVEAAQAIALAVHPCVISGFKLLDAARAAERVFREKLSEPTTQEIETFYRTMRPYAIDRTGIATALHDFVKSRNHKCEPDPRREVISRMVGSARGFAADDSEIADRIIAYLHDEKRCSV